MGSMAKQTLNPRIFAIVLVLAFVVVLSLSITAYSKSKTKYKGGRWIESQEGDSCPKPSPKCDKVPAPVAMTLIHYATANITPQQTSEEIKISARVLAKKSPCNFLVFGLGYDSPLWAALNNGGRTVFLEEDEKWIGAVREKHPQLEAHYVEYPTMLTEAYDLLKYAQAAPECAPAQRGLKFSICKLALRSLPADIYNTEWDAIMIDAPRGYFPEAPGRMQAIYSSALMALRATAGKSTDVFVHDVERTVEDMYSKAFLCAENLVAAQGRLWHFSIPAKAGDAMFCSTAY